MAIFIETTEDGSPTAHFNEFEQERMHHSGGAFGETVYIYGPAIQYAFSKTENPCVLSLGTGLGYNEMLSCAFGLLFEQEFTLHSYEASDALNSSLKSWVFDEEPGEISFSVYNKILNLTANVFDIPEVEIKYLLRKKLQDGSWILHGAFDLPKFRYHAILYDFFSRKAMEKFWTEEYLTEFFNIASMDPCAVATYACTGPLKRALKANYFEFIERKGYLWKRTSTFARRSESSYHRKV